MTKPLLEAQGICKGFPGVQALQDVDLTLNQGEILAVVGENGAGKSTLMKILGGVQSQDTGTIHFQGEPLHLSDVADAQHRGIALIHQELCLATNLDVASNVFLGRESTFAGPLNLLSRSIYQQSIPFLERLGLEVSPKTPVHQLSIGQQQLVEIARALSLRSTILIMDEPTSSLTQRESDRLLQVMRDLKAEGISILYISHRLQEVQEIADRVVVLRDGQNAGELNREEINHDALVNLMVGRELQQFFDRQHRIDYEQSSTILEVKGMSLDLDSKRPFDFNLHAGEILGIAGLMGSGRTELAEALFGIAPAVQGTVTLQGVPIDIYSVNTAIDHGIFLLPEDRRISGLVLDASVKENLSLATLMEMSRFRLIQRGREKQHAQSLCDRLNVRTPNISQTVGLLSGGNQQKVVLGKGLSRTPRVFILDEPTRGVDVGAKREIYGIMDELAGQGVGMLMISSDLEEIIGISDRVLVMYQGSIAGELRQDELTEEAIMHLATGGASQK